MTRQELYCHGCARYVSFDLDEAADGDCEIPCPACGHVHYRTVQAGVVTERRWASSGPVAASSFVATNVTSSQTSTWDTWAASGTTTTPTSIYLYQAWASTTTSS